MNRRNFVVRALGLGLGAATTLGVLGPALQAGTINYHVWYQYKTWKKPQVWSAHENYNLAQIEARRARNSLGQGYSVWVAYLKGT